MLWTMGIFSVGTPLQRRWLHRKRINLHAHCKRRGSSVLCRSGVLTALHTEDDVVGEGEHAERGRQFTDTVSYQNPECVTG